MSEDVFEIGLSAWIIQDGNYPDFHCGDRVRFALEFYSKSGMKPSSGRPSLHSIGDAQYDASGTVCFSEPEVYVVDFGSLLAYGEREPAASRHLGATLAGQLYLGIDYYAYFEMFAKRRGIPALIYEWVIEGIGLETAPFIETSDSKGRKVFTRDESKHKRVPVDRTDARNDDNGFADYVLRCRRTTEPASWYLDGRSSQI